MEKEKQKTERKEHILVCLSFSPSNEKIIRTAAQMARAFGANFTALYVQTAEPAEKTPEDQARLQKHIRLAEQSGAEIVTTHSEDIALQIAEYARISEVTRIVIGKSMMDQGFFRKRRGWTERLTDLVPDLEIQNDLLQPINFDHIPNASNIGDMYYETSEQFDPGNLYSIPYCWGTIGILYNKKMVTEPIDSWSVLWDTNYRDSILMQDSVRDAFAVALKDLGYSLNSTNIKELTEAKDLLVTQKPLVQAYVVDQVRDKMIGNEAAIGVIYSGEAIYTKRENPDLEYVVPKEGSNVWIDSWCIPKDAQHVENAEKFLNFLCRPDIALKNFEYITYSTPNDAARELIEDDDIRNSKIAFPDEETLARCETFTYLGDDADEVYNQLWREVKSN